MSGDKVCVGGHDLDADFRPVRLFKSDGASLVESDPVSIGDIWEMTYRPVPSVTPPHVEDVRVDKATVIDTIDNLAVYLLDQAPIWMGPPDVLFDETLAATENGRAYVPAAGPLPRMSTGYWVPDSELIRQMWDAKATYDYTGRSAIKRFKWVGMEDPPKKISDMTLVRVSLARYYVPSAAPAGYYADISGVY
jgi:hypothetical protein